jgi:hypothetical protein
MPITGPPPKDDDQKVTRVKPVHDWIHVVNVPYRGRRPKLGAVPTETKRWWAVVSTMPHCALWTPADWQFALDTSRIHAAFIAGDMIRAQELRVREKAMGTTMDARRDLRIRYVDESSEDVPEAIPDNILDFEAERRRRLMDAG